MSRASGAPGAVGERRLTTATKAVFSLGDHTVNVVLTALTLLYIRYLTDVVHFAPALAGAVPWLGRVVDAFADPLMGRVSDLTRWRSGRRRPWFLIGCVPLGVCFALLWIELPTDSNALRFAYYAAIYLLVSLAMTVVNVPYLALIPEMSRDYDERTSLNTWRAAGALVAVFVTLGMSLLARSLGDHGRAWSLASLVVAAWLVLPWIAVHRVTWERPVAAGQAPLGLVAALRSIFGHGSYQRLCAIFIPGRIAIDLVSVMFFYYVACVIGRRDDFEPTLATFLGVVIASLPFWLWLARHLEKRSVLVIGIVWWIAAQLVMGLGAEDWPRWALFAVAAFAGVGYAVVDVMPWAMLPDVIDEDELATGERREGLYTGMFTFLRKLGGATAVLLAGVVLQLAGYDGAAAQQSDATLAAIRGLMALAPALLLVLSAWAARRYPLSREAHHAIRSQLEARAGRRSKSPR